MTRMNKAIAAGGCLVVARLLSSCGSEAPTGSTASPPRADAAVARIAYADAKPILAELAGELPADLKGKSEPELDALWPDWVARHNREVRARLEHGDEDSIVNLWLYGTSFTKRPRATERDVARLASRAKTEALLIGRLDDLVAALAAPGANERLQFARHVVERHRINITTPPGQDQARQYLVEIRKRMIGENDRYRRMLASAALLNDDTAKLSAYSAVYRDRGLSSDTSLAADFALDQALDAMSSKRLIAPGSIRRVAIIGPGLDFTDKAEGYDFYPLQTIQPFAIVDSLVRLGLAAGDLQLTTFDLSPRVNQHLQGARARAERGDVYVLHLPLDDDSVTRQWRPEFVRYWERFGGRIGRPIDGVGPPPGMAGLRVRAVAVQPAITLTIAPMDVNIVIERPAPIADAERFDLIVATNVLVYYDTFDQALALTNVAAMLKPGGYFLTNYAVTPRPPMTTAPALITKVFWDRQNNGDTLLAYQRR